MDFYITISLVTVIGLLAWWLFLAISGLRRDESSTKQAEGVTRKKPVGLANSLISMFRSCNYDSSTEQLHSAEPGR